MGPGGESITVLHVLASTHRRGSEVFACDLAAALQRRGLRSQLVAVQNSVGQPQLEVPTIGGLTPVGWRRLRGLARGSDIVIAHGSRSLPACAIACAGHGVAPFLYRSVGDPSFWSPTGLRRRRTDMLLGRAIGTVTLWEGARSTLIERGFSPADVHVIPNAVDTHRFPPTNHHSRIEARAKLGIDPTATVALFMGAMSLEKRPELMLQLARRRPHLVVVLVGDGPLREQLSVAAAPLPNVELHEGTHSPEMHLAASDVVVIPSTTEGMPAVAIEAGLCCVPVVATDVGGVSEIVLDNRTGILVDDPADLPTAVDRAISARSDLGPRAREHCSSSFDIDVIADQWLELVLSVVGRRSSHG